MSEIVKINGCQIYLNHVSNLGNIKLFAPTELQRKLNRVYQSTCWKLSENFFQKYVFHNVKKYYGLLLDIPISYVQYLQSSIFFRIIYFQQSFCIVLKLFQRLNCIPLEQLRTSYPLFLVKKSKQLNSISISNSMVLNQVRRWMCLLLVKTCYSVRRYHHIELQNIYLEN